MDIITLIGAIQLGIAALQLKLDHFSRPANRANAAQLDQFYDLGEAIRSLEFALSETVDFIGQTNDRAPNPRLATLWENASNSLRNVTGTAAFADIAFEKNLYWRNPDFYGNQGPRKLYSISLDNVLNQLRPLRTNYEKLHRKINN